MTTQIIKKVLFGILFTVALSGLYAQQVKKAKEAKWYEKKIERSNLHNDIKNMLDRWSSIHNTEKPSNWDK